MLKGYERKLIMIRTKDSAFFESAFFVIKSDACKNRENRAGMVEEARKILKDSGNVRVASGNKRKRSLLFFLMGFLSGGLAMLVIWLLFV